jgi:hypothetical protein
MPPPTLHQYDLDLCNYVRESLRRYMAVTKKKKSRPSPERIAPRCDNLDLLAEYNLLPPSERVAKRLSQFLPPSLWRYLSEEKRPTLLLGSYELECFEKEVADTAAFFFPFLGIPLWTPRPILHRKFIHCLRSIPKRVPDAAIEQFAMKSPEFGRRLEEPGTTLWHGIGVVRDWVCEIRKSLDAMGHHEWLPITDGGSFPTPSSDSKIPPWLDGYVARIRDKFREIPRLHTWGINEVCDKVTGKRRYLLEALRYLQATGEYHGRQATSRPKKP